MQRIKRIHFIGIGGAGMSGLAEIFHHEAYQISGSDIALTPTITHLRDIGITVHINHDADHVQTVDLVVVSAAIASDNIELIAARELRLPIVPRAAMLDELMRHRQGIAVAGTHGKTTTTSLVSNILLEAGLDPTFVIGGKLNNIASNAYLGNSDYLVVEADESDASFLHLQPQISVVTNIDIDHMQTYDYDIDRLYGVFHQFLQQLPIDGLAIVCLDDPGVQVIYQNIPRRVVTYGFDERADIRAYHMRQLGTQTYFNVYRQGFTSDLQLCVNLPGQHNVLNALAAIAVATQLEVSSESIQQALRQFSGVERRFQIYGHLALKRGQALLVDDYGHHPREISATIQAARSAWPQRRLVMVYQPHRYTRTRDLYEDFTQILSEVDVLIMLEVYGAGEQPIANADARSLCSSIRQRGKVDPIFVPMQQALWPNVEHLIEDDDILLLQGAGDIGKLAKQLANDRLIVQRDI